MPMIVEAVGEIEQHEQGDACQQQSSQFHGEDLQIEALAEHRHLDLGVLQPCGEVLHHVFIAVD